MCVAALLGSSRAHAEPAAHVTRGPYLQALEPTSVEIRAELDVAAPASVTLTPRGPDAGAPRVVRDAASTMHVLRADGLLPQTRYAYSFVAGSSTISGELTTAPPPDSREPFTFLVYGDNRTDAVGHASVVRAMLQSPSDFVIHTGDFVATGADDSDWQSFFDIEAALVRDRCVFSCVGNHELTDGAGASYLRFFGRAADARAGSRAGSRARSEEEEGAKPRLYSSFRWAGTRFFLLDAMEVFDEGPERAWLDDELTRADAEPGLEWRIVVMHHSPWSAGPHGGNARALAGGLPALFSRHHVDLLVAGHDHIYERGFASGLRYLVSGGGGAPLYPVDHPLASTRKVESVHHFVEVTVQPGAVRLVARREDGSVIERCGFARTRNDWDCDPPPPAAAVPSPASLSSSPASAPSARCACDAVGKARAKGSRSLGAAFAFLLILLARRRPNRG
jgi:hypothetical protein